MITCLFEYHNTYINVVFQFAEKHLCGNISSLTNISSEDLIAMRKRVAQELMLYEGKLYIQLAAFLHDFSLFLLQFNKLIYFFSATFSQSVFLGDAYAYSTGKLRNRLLQAGFM